MDTTLREGLSEVVTFPLSTKGLEGDSQEENQGESAPTKGVRLYKEIAGLFERQNGHLCWDGVIINFICSLNWDTGCPD